MVLMVESICGQGFAYTREVEERKAKHLVKTRAKEATKNNRWQPLVVDQNQSLAC
jgi:hypothetical protein